MVGEGEARGRGEARHTLASWIILITTFVPLKTAVKQLALLTKRKVVGWGWRAWLYLLTHLWNDKHTRTFRPPGAPRD